MFVSVVWIYSALGAALVGLAFLVLALNSMPPTASAIQANLATCHAILNQTNIRVKATTRWRLYIPKELYPNQGNLLNFETVKGSATAYIASSELPPGKGKGASQWCYATDYEFNGEGQVDLVATSSRFGIPKYVVHFHVLPAGP